MAANDLQLNVQQVNSASGRSMRPLNLDSERSPSTNHNGVAPFLVYFQDVSRAKVVRKRCDSDIVFFGGYPLKT